MNRVYPHSVRFQTPRQRRGVFGTAEIMISLLLMRTTDVVHIKANAQRIRHRCQNSRHFAHECPAPLPLHSNSSAVHINSFSGLRNNSNQQRHVNNVHNNYQYCSRSSRHVPSTRWSFIRPKSVGGEPPTVFDEPSAVKRLSQVLKEHKHCVPLIQ